MADGPRKPTMRAATFLERIQSGVADALNLPDSWRAPAEAPSVEAARQTRDRELSTPMAQRPATMRAPTMLESFRDAARPITSVLEAVGSPLENAEMGPAKAITLAARAAGKLPGRLTGEAELLERLIPRTASGDAIDYRAFPKTIDAVADLIQKYPRVASHVDSISMGDMPEGWAGGLDVPNRITQYIRNMGGETYRNAVNAPVARIRLSPEIETAGGAFGPRETLAHEFTHAAQYIADPRRFDGTYDTARQGVSAMIPAARGVPDAGYSLNPAEVAARAVGRRFANPDAGLSYADAIADVVPDGVSMDALSNAWQRSRQVFTDVASKIGQRLSPAP